MNPTTRTNVTQTTISKAAMLESLAALEPMVETNLEAMDQDRNIPTSLFEGLRETGLFRASWPVSRGGLEWDPMTQIELLERVSRMDGSLGWIATFATLTPFFAARLDEAALAELFPVPDITTAGVYAPTGQAEVVPGGYKVSGRWTFGSGCRHAAVMHAGVTIFEDGAARLGSDGQPETRIVMFPKDQCTILLDTWDTIGLRGTGSHDYVLDDLFIPEERAFNMFDSPHFDGPLYRYAALFLFSHAPMPLGIARAAIDKVIELGEQKRTWPSGRYLREDGTMQQIVAEAEATLGSARSYVFSTTNALWETLIRGDEPSLDERARFRLALAHATRSAKDVVTRMFDVAATSAIQRGNPLERQLRDILTLSQHRVVQAKMYRPIGRVLLGMGSSDPYL